MRRFQGNVAAAQVLRGAGITLGNIRRQRALGDYGDGNPNALPPGTPYSEAEVFRGEPGGGVANAPVILTRNRNSFNLLPFAYQATDASKLLLPSNEARVFLFVQNQSLADAMYFNFTNEASLNIGIELYPAQGFVFDQAVPWNAITVFVNSATPQRGIIVEGAIQL